MDETLMKFYDEVVFNENFDYGIHQQKWNDENEGESAEKFLISFQYSGFGELCFTFKVQDSKKKTAFMININSKKSIELYHCLKKEIEQIKTLKELNDLVMD